MSDVAAFLHGGFADGKLRAEMFATAGELAYLCAGGWPSTTPSTPSPSTTFTVALKLTAEAGDAPLAGHILRAMARQAVDLGHPQQALSLAAASMDGGHYALACPRERALFGVVHARALAASGNRQAATRALLRAEDDLAAATPGDEEPGRVFFFAEASLAHESACALRDVGDLTGSIREFQRSVRTRKAATFTRTHAVTLGYLGAVHARQGAMDEACAIWSQALEMMGRRPLRPRPPDRPGHVHDPVIIPGPGHPRRHRPRHPRLPIPGTNRLTTPTPPRRQPHEQRGVRDDPSRPRRRRPVRTHR
jgi:hypothetical protein